MSLAPNLTMTPSSFTPNESAANLFQERANLDGAVAGGFVNGILAMVCWICLGQLIRGKSVDRVNWGLVAYVILMLGLSTAYIGTNTKYVEMMFIDDRNYPGGPVGFYQNDFPIPMASATIVLYGILNIFSDGFLLYRCFTVWHRSWQVTGLPVALYLVTIAMVIIAIFETIKPGAVFFTKVTESFTLLWFALSISLNLLLTLLIAGRLVTSRKSLSAVIGKAHSQIYTSSMAIFVESAMLYSISSIVVIVSYGLNSPFQNVALAIHACVMSISPVLIIMRLAIGNAYSKEAMTLASQRAILDSSTGNPAGRETGISLKTLHRRESGSEHTQTPRVSESRAGDRNV